MTKSQIISTKIAAEMQNGKTIQEAIDAVFGAGAYKRIAGEVYDSLRKEA
jgi:hypothetical protein